MNEKPAPPVLRRKARVKLWLQRHHEYFEEVSHWKKPACFYALMADACRWLRDRVN
jgi:hypothetical protein